MTVGTYLVYFTWSDGPYVYDTENHYGSTSLWFTDEQTARTVHEGMKKAPNVGHSLLFDHATSRKLAEWIRNEADGTAKDQV